MAATDHGGFDVALDLTEEILSALLTGSVAVPTPPDRDVDVTEIRLHVHVRSLVPTAVDVLVGESVLLRGTYVLDATVQATNVGGGPVGIPPNLRELDVHGTFAIAAGVSIGTVGGTRGVVLTPNAASSTATVDANGLFSSPAVQLVLAAAFIAGGETGYQQKRQAIQSAVELRVAELARGAGAGMAPALAIPQLPGLTFAAVRTSGLALKVLGTVTLPPGNPTLATGSALRRDVTGGPLDHVSLVVNNGTLLGGVRALVSGGLGIPATAPPWAAGHPAALLSRTPIAPPRVTLPSLFPGVPAATPFVDFFLAQINPAGLLQLDVRARVVSWGSFATATASATATVPFTATVTAGTLTVGLGTPSVTTMSDIEINPALYVVAALTGQFMLFTILAAIDLFVGPFVNGLLTSALATLRLAPILTAPLPGPLAGLTVTTVSAVEPAAPFRIVTLPGPPPIPIPLDKIQDLTVRLA